MCTVYLCCVYVYCERVSESASQDISPELCNSSTPKNVSRPPPSTVNQTDQMLDVLGTGRRREPFVWIKLTSMKSSGLSRSVLWGRRSRSESHDPSPPRVPLRYIPRGLC